MKKQTVIIVLFFLLFSNVIQAQVKPFRFGFKLAPNMAWLSPDSKDYKIDGAGMGFSWGFVSDFALTENYFIETGFNMDYLNTKLKYPHNQAIETSPGVFDTITGLLKRRYRLQYLDIPLALKMRTNQFGKMAFFGMIGLSTSFNIRAKAEDEFKYQTSSEQTISSDNDIKDGTRFIKEALLLGLGTEYFIDSSTSIMLGISFNNGFTNILDGKNSVDNTVEEKASLSFFELNLGVIF